MLGSKYPPRKTRKHIPPIGVLKESHGKSSFLIQVPAGDDMSGATRRGKGAPNRLPHVFFQESQPVLFSLSRKKTSVRISAIGNLVRSILGLVSDRCIFFCTTYHDFIGYVHCELQKTTINYQTTVDSHVITPDFLRVSSFWLSALITEFCLFWNYATNLHESRPSADRQLQMLQMRWTW